MDIASLLEEGLNRLNISWTNEDIRNLEAYCRELFLWNPRYKLVRASQQEFVTGHIFDALAALPVLNQLCGNGPLRSADVGSGNGIPGIPLALMQKNSSMTLIERSAKRSGFLRNAVVASGLHNRVEVFEGDVRDLQDLFDLITFRAVSDLGGILPLLLPLAAPGGIIAAYKGRDESVSRELDSLDVPMKVTLHDLHPPFLPEHRRQLVVLHIPCSLGDEGI